MAIFASDADAQAFFVRKRYNEELGREPSVQEMTAWTAFLAAHGADATLAGIRDSDEAAKFRAKRGW